MSPGEMSALMNEPESKVARLAAKLALLFLYAVLIRSGVKDGLAGLLLPVSEVTTGQSAPEDIEKAEKGKLLNLILNGN